MTNFWPLTKLSKACIKITDGTHHSPEVQFAEPGADRFKYVTSKNVRPWGLDLNNIAYVTADVHREIYARCNPEIGDVLLTKDGANTGTVAINTLDEEFSLLSSVAVLKPDPERLDSKYLRYFIESPSGSSRILGKMTGTAIRRIVLRQIKDADIPLAPLDEQRRIVAEIEKQLTRLEVGVTALRLVQAKLKRYRAAVLKAACEGRLVPTEAELARQEGRPYEPASELLACILTERRKNWQRRGKYKEPTARFGFVPPDLPEGWAVCSLDQMMLNITDGDHQPPPQTDIGVPFLVIGNVKSGKVDLENSRFVSREYADNVDTFRKPAKGDVLYTLVGSFGLAVRVTADDEFCIQRHIAVLRPHASSPTSYLAQILNSFFIFQQADACATGTAQKTVPLAGLRRFTIPLPPIAEQTRIVAEVERRLSVVEELETVVAANLRRATRLRQSILQYALAGGGFSA